MSHADTRRERYLNSFGKDQYGDIVRANKAGKVIGVHSKNERPNAKIVDKIIPTDGSRYLVSNDLSPKEKLMVLNIGPKHIWEN